MKRKLSELTALCKQLGLEVKPSGKRESKEDYIQALQKHFYSKREPHRGMEMVMELGSPMLCFPYWNLKDEEKQDLENNSEYWAEKKYDGNRMLVHWHPDYGVSFFSRNLSVEDYLPVMYSVYLKDPTPFEGYPEFLLDAEIISTNPFVDTSKYTKGKGVLTKTGLSATSSVLSLSPEMSILCQKTEALMRIHIFDVVYFGRYVMDMRAEERRHLLEQNFKETEQFVLAEKYEGVSFEELFWQVVEDGGEGIVYKNKNQKYLPGLRRRDGWIKRKRDVSSFIGDLDGFITGFLPGDKDSGWADLVGALCVSVYLDTGEIHEIARVTNIPLEFRKKITVYKNGEPHLDESLYGKVVEINGQSVSARSLRLTHAVLKRFREDKNPEDCVLSKEELLRNVL